MNKLTVAILALALTGSVAFAQGQGGGRGGQGGRGGNRGAGQQMQGGGAGGAGMAGGMGNFGGGQQGGAARGNRGGQGGQGGRGGQQGGQGGRGGRGGQQGGMGQGGFGQGGMGGMGQGGFGQGGMGGMGMGQGGFGQGGMGMGQGGFGQGGMGMGQGGMMGAPRNGQLQQTIDRLKAETPREEALKKIEEKDKEAYDKVRKEIDAANAQLLELAKKAEIELPETAEQQKAKTLEFLAKEKDAIDKLLETDKTDSATAMRSFNELAQKNQITIAPAGRGGAAASGQAGARRAQGNTSTIRQLQEKFPEEYAEIQKLRDTDPTAYRTKMRELQQKLNQAN